ncbi:MAG: histidine phosphatase family protein [Vicingaceae bacterium]
MKELFIIRHAKSSWSNANLKDFDRPLNERGLRDAPRMGERLQKKNLKPDLIVSSPANRALTTAKTIAEKLSYPSDCIREESLIYGATVNDMIQLLSKTQDKVKRLFVFGHNPTFSSLAEELSNESLGSIPTCAVVALKVPFESWQMLSRGTADLWFYDYPKNKS